jgi:hypothetical protein
MQDLVRPNRSPGLFSEEQVHIIQLAQAENSQRLKDELALIYQRIVKRARLKVLFKRAKILESQAVAGDDFIQSQKLKRYVAEERQLEAEVIQVADKILEVREKATKKMQETIAQLPMELVRRVMVMRAIETDKELHGPNLELVDNIKVVRVPQPPPLRGPTGRRKSDGQVMKVPKPNSGPNSPQTLISVASTVVSLKKLEAGTEGPECAPSPLPHKAALKRTQLVNLPDDEFEPEYDEINLLRITSAAPVDENNYPKPGLYANSDILSRSRTILEKSQTSVPTHKPPTGARSPQSRDLSLRK